MEISRNENAQQQVSSWLTDKSSKLFRQSRAERGFVGLNPAVARGTRHGWV
jgi:hypothetical protein